MGFSEIGLGLAFIAGLASFLSPCVFSLVPAYIGYLGGRSVAMGGTEQENRWMTLLHGLAFVLGFSTIFISLGLAASALGGLLYSSRDWLEKIGGVVVIIFGLHMVGILRIKFLEYDLRPQTLPDRRRGFLASYLMGIFFSAGWSPCVGPILGAILTLSLNGGSMLQGVLLLSAYSLGLAIPFLVAAVEISLVTSLLRRHRKTMFYAEKAMGVILIVVGILLFMGRFQTLAQYGTFLGTFDELALGRTILLILGTLAVLGLIPAYIASRKGRQFFEWWLFGAALFPVALPVAWFLKPKQPETALTPDSLP
jgi:cytochrome c-type biogenesis protein